MSNELFVDGECHCGKISISAQVDKNKVRACHCTDCQKFSGAPLRAIAIASVESITIKGTPRGYIKIGDSGNKRIQAFCEYCGTQLYATNMEKTSFNLRTGFLKQKDLLEPKEHVFTDSSMAWFKKTSFEKK